MILHCSLHAPLPMSRVHCYLVLMYPFKLNMMDPLPTHLRLVWLLQQGLVLIQFVLAEALDTHVLKAATDVVSMWPSHHHTLTMPLSQMAVRLVRHVNNTLNIPPALS